MEQTKIGPDESRTGIIRKKNGMRLLYDEIRKRILSLELAPGAELDETTLARQYGISRTPVREALIRLSSDNLIVLVPNRSPRVASLDITDIRIFNEALQLCQRIVTRWAAERRTAEDLELIEQCRAQYAWAAKQGSKGVLVEANRAFHAAIGTACGNQYFAATYDRLLNDGMRLIGIAMSSGEQFPASSLTDYLALTASEHDEMVAAIRAQEPDRAETLANNHASEGISRVADYLAHTLADTIDLRFN
ncbi:MAG: GntR family transcriptional regulator [Alphaproteobacteria bacterium]|nr:GntR family transcriptional regulator [Alphaproteobacteria bacterium]